MPWPSAKLAMHIWLAQNPEADSWVPGVLAEGADLTVGDVAAAGTAAPAWRQSRAIPVCAARRAIELEHAALCSSFST